MFSPDSLNSYPELTKFLESSNSEEQALLAGQLWEEYFLEWAEPKRVYQRRELVFSFLSPSLLSQIMPQNSIDFFLSNFRCTPLEIAAGVGKLEHFNILLNSNSSIRSQIKGKELILASAGGHLEIVNRLLELEEIREKLDVEPLIWAAAYGQLEVVDRLLEASREKIKINYQPLILAARYGCTDVVRRFLTFPQMLQFAERFEEDYGTNYVHPFIKEEIGALERKKREFEQDNPTQTFDLQNPEQARLCFYMIKNLIRRNSLQLIDNIRFLLSIPAVKALAHTSEATPCALPLPNELVGFAVSIGNYEAEELLLQLPAVKELAMQDAFYRTTEQKDKYSFTSWRVDFFQYLIGYNPYYTCPQPEYSRSENPIFFMHCLSTGIGTLLFAAGLLTLIAGVFGLAGLGLGAATILGTPAATATALGGAAMSTASYLMFFHSPQIKPQQASEEQVEVLREQYQERNLVTFAH